MRVAADNQIDPVSSQKPGQLPLHLVRSTFVFVAPVHAGDHAIHAVVLDRRQVRGDPHRVDGIDRQSGRDRKTVRTVGVVQQGETYAARFETERMPRPEIRAVQKNARMFDAVPVEFPDRRTDAFRSAVAAVVVGQHGHIHAGLAQGVGQHDGGAEHRVARIGCGGGQRRLEVHHGNIRPVHPRGQRLEDRRVVKAPAAAGRLDLRQVLHHVAAEEHPDALRRRFGQGGRRLSGRRARDPRQQHDHRDMPDSDTHGLLPFPFGILREPPLGHPLALFEEFADAPQRRSAPHGQQRGPEQLAHRDRCGDGRDPHQEEKPPDPHAEIVLALDDERMEETDDQKRRHANHQPRKVVLCQKFHDSPACLPETAGRVPPQAASRGQRYEELA